MYGITVSYDEVLRFRSSAAIFTHCRPTKHISRAVTKNEFIMAAWIDNFDLNVYTPMAAETLTLLLKM